MRVALVAIAALLVAVHAVDLSAEGVNLFEHRQKLRRAAHHNPTNEIQMLAQTDEAVETVQQPAPAAAAPPAPAPAPAVQAPVPAPVPVPAAAMPSTFQTTLAGQTLNCHQSNGQTVCDKPGESGNINMLLIEQLKAQLEAEKQSAKNSVELAKQMVEQVRDETKQFVQEAEKDARVEREENEKLRGQIVKLQEELQHRPAIDQTQQLLQLQQGTDDKQDLQAALDEYQKLKSEYESLD